MWDLPGSGRSPGGRNGNPSGILAWRILWTEEPGGLLSIGLRRVRHDWSDLACMHALKKEMATHSSVLAWRIPGTEEPGGVPSMGSRRVGHSWSDLAAAAARENSMAGGACWAIVHGVAKELDMAERLSTCSTKFEGHHRHLVSLYVTYSGWCIFSL